MPKLHALENANALLMIMRKKISEDNENIIICTYLFQTNISTGEQKAGYLVRYLVNKKIYTE